MRLILCLFFILSNTVVAAASINDYFNSIKSNRHALYAFLKEMPKGGELHYHLAGGAYPETMLDLATSKNYCINSETNSISRANPCDGVKTHQLPEKPTLYNQLIHAWSMKSFTPKFESGHDHFFASFSKFMPIVQDTQAQLLATIMKRAADQHELYLEILISPDNALSSSFAKYLNHTTDFKEKQRILLANKNFQKNIHHTIAESAVIIKQARHALGCGKQLNQKACALTIKFQYYVLREQPLNNVFAQALNGFAAAKGSDVLVGVNLVQAEDGVISLRDYQQQMQIFKFLHSAYPNVHISLHAGELASNTLTTPTTDAHIHDAIFIGQAQRIGHGVDINKETNSEQLLNYMAKKPIPVEINLTSNQKILNISGKEHPFSQYLSHQVPIVLSTDDEGVLRTSLTKEYMKAVTDYHLDYPTIKSFNRNALTYSFLPGKSLWKDPQRSIAVNACQDLTSPLCLKFIKKNKKAKLQWQLERNFIIFETNINLQHQKKLHPCYHP